MEQVGIRRLRQQASQLVQRAEAGEVLIITVNGRPVARLVPMEKNYGVNLMRFLIYFKVDLTLSGKLTLLL